MGKQAHSRRRWTPLCVELFINTHLWVMHSSGASFPKSHFYVEVKFSKHKLLLLWASKCFSHRELCYFCFYQCISFFNKRKVQKTADMWLNIKVSMTQPPTQIWSWRKELVCGCRLSLIRRKQSHTNADCRILLTTAKTAADLLQNKLQLISANMQ